MGIATSYGVNMAKLVANAGGQLQQLPEVSYVGGKLRVFNETVVYAGQASGASIAVARLPVPFVLQHIQLLADTSSGSATIALGNAGAGNSAIYAAAAAFTALNTPTLIGLAAKCGVLITSGVDSQGIALGPNAPGQGGGNYEDIILTTGAAALPGAGNLKLAFFYTID